MKGPCVAACLALVVAVADAWVATSAFNGQAVGTHTCKASNAVSMKIFDWKRRDDDSANTAVKELSPATLVPSPGSRHRKARKGRGISAGQGASCGFGMRGQRSRSGPGVRAGFEGGQQPLYRRLPKFVGRPMGPGHTKKEFHLITLEALNSAAEGSTVSFETLHEQGTLTKTSLKWHKVVGNGELNVKNLTVQAHAFTGSAKEAIEGAGGKCQLLSPTTNEIVDMTV
ncbi:chloroplast 50S ribosomal protein L15 [Tribonema minus]|uniref:Chloroplast 50S ribosomal protein L15 n=1 Tax=Tribonema minus TaxID=303371 RepID=A0A836CHQ3_9STRA|nr:chloroplast 50S ribosomal protein L15 [Tribonema minus]